MLYAKLETNKDILLNAAISIVIGIPMGISLDAIYDGPVIFYQKKETILIELPPKIVHGELES